jgi:hypothetical protein
MNQQNRKQQHRNNNNFNNRSTNRKRILKNNSQQLAVPRPMSILGETIDRAIDILIDIYAVNSVGTPFYSFSNSAGSPTMTVNITDLMILQFTEYSELVRIYGLSKLKKIQLGFTRSSNFIGGGSSTLQNTPSLFLQASTIPYTAGSATLQRAVAQSDNSVEIDLQTFDPKSFNIMLPPHIVSNNRANNQTYTFGSQTWISTKLNNVQNFPDLFLNLGSLATPTFESSAPNNSFLIGQIHGRMQLSFAGPIVG